MEKLPTVLPIPKNQYNDKSAGDNPLCAVSTNDGLTNSAKNIGMLLNMKNVFLVPFGQDDPVKKTASLVADFTKIYDTLIPRNIRLAEAPSHGLPINMYDTKSAGAESYRMLAKEVMERKNV